MNKIHNNLNIENLIRTEEFKSFIKEKKEEIIKETDWFNQFNEKQQEEILKGLKNNVDVSSYANEKFTVEKMREIRDKLLTEKYAII